MAGLRIALRSISSVSFLTFFVVSCTICVSAKFAGGCLSSSAYNAFSSLCIVFGMNEDGGTHELADSGEAEGEVSDTIGESKVELVVVGEDSVDSENSEDTLPRW